MESVVLHIEKLGKSYGSFEAVKDISFSVAAKEIFALIGPNGAGKSTTLRMLATLLKPTHGVATIAGFNVQTQAADVRKNISYLAEEAGVYKNLRGSDYLTFMAALYADDAATQKKYVAFASDLTKLGPRLNDKISTYSKGMTRKLLLARSVMTQPKLAILDEPTSGLDIVNAYDIRKTIKDLATQGMAVLLSSHNLLDIESLSDRVGIIHQGSLLDIGTPDSLKQKYHATNLEEVFMAIAT